MATAAANPLLRFEDSNGDPLAGGTLEFYESGSSTPKTAYGDSSESTSFTTKTLDSRGEAVVYFGSGSYKLVIKDSGGSTIKTLDPVIGAITSVAASSEWISSGDTPTYVSSISFTVPGDKTASYEVGRRIKTTNTSGTTYSVVAASSYNDPNTTITVENQSGTLDSGLSSVDLGLMTATNTSMPRIHEGSMRVIGCNCANNSSTPNTQFDMDADAIVLRNSKNQTVTVWNPGAAITNNISTAGPAANGRDQAGAFSNSSWVHFYWIWNGTTLATISSATAPPTGPTLPSGYTHWAYACSVYLNSSGALRLVVCTGNTVSYGIADGGATQILAAGQQTTMTSIDCSSLVPPLPGLIFLHGTILVQHTSATSFAGYVRPDGGFFENNGRRIAGAQVAAANQSASADGSIFIPNISQSIAYRINSVPATSGGLYLSIDGYTVPNGG
ncbi:hypothetical protein [Methylocaldum gracile]|jgi:hypothetical protein|uniref:hypothetical protein n=1 Tax=Methylocaldum sp. 0917 TaxID=2485163 RepID=UPI00105FF7C1